MIRVGTKIVVIFHTAITANFAMKLWIARSVIRVISVRTVKIARIVGIAMTVKAARIVLGVSDCGTRGIIFLTKNTLRKIIWRKLQN